MAEATVTARCISCGAKREIHANEVPEGDMPLCQNCGMIMEAVKVTR